MTLWAAAAELGMSQRVLTTLELAAAKLKVVTTFLRLQKLAAANLMYLEVSMTTGEELRASKTFPELSELYTTSKALLKSPLRVLALQKSSSATTAKLETFLPTAAKLGMILRCQNMSSTALSFQKSAAAKLEVFTTFLSLQKSSSAMAAYYRMPRMT